MMLQDIHKWARLEGKKMVQGSIATKRDVNDESSHKKRSNKRRAVVVMKGEYR